LASKKNPFQTPSGFSTKAIHHGKSFAEETGAVMPPIFTSATFAHGNPEGFDYTRSGNPNFKILESVIASLEDCKYSTVFASGVSAITAITSSLKTGDLILCEENLYGCTVRLFEKVFKKFGLKTFWVDFTKSDSINKINDLKPAMIWLESPTNPLLKIIDIKRICTIASKHQIPVVVDNTFATPLLQKPLELGATLSLTSTTKYINGHSDALGGAVCSEDSKWHERMTFAQKALGLQPSPFDCWLITRGVKTLPLRLERQVDNASSLATFLCGHPFIEWVRYPFRPDHPQNEIAKKQMLAGGAIITATLKTDLNQTFSFCKNLKYFTLAESLGGVESLVCHPSTMTHASVNAETKSLLGINDSLIRFSIGCEDLEDLIADLSQALDLIQ
tara:strand:- start:13495 stop:14664 length:1170 start_codon:yes stop_codon:yes gene_type:complete